VIPFVLREDENYADFDSVFLLYPLLYRTEYFPKRSFFYPAITRRFYNCANVVLC